MNSLVIELLVILFFVCGLALLYTWIRYSVRKSERERNRANSLLWAKRNFNDLKTGRVHDPDTIIWYLRAYLIEGGLSLADLNTTDEELEALKVKCLVHTFGNCLEYMRSGEMPMSHLVAFLTELEENKLTPSDIGSSDLEISEIKRKCLLHGNQKRVIRLSRIENRIEELRDKQRRLIEQIRTCTFTPEELNTTDEELRRLTPPEKVATE
jgi:hypothetical protein